MLNLTTRSRKPEPALYSRTLSDETTVQKQAIIGYLRPQLLFMVSFLMTIQPAAAHWCNSGARLTNIEQAICGDAGLVNKDIELNRLYSALGGSRNAVLKVSQRQWMNGRNLCTGMDCLHAWYDERRRVLRAMAGVPAAPAAPPAPTYTPPPPAAAAPAPHSAPRSGSLEKLPDIKPF